MRLSPSRPLLPPRLLVRRSQNEGPRREAARKWLAARLADGEWHDSASIIGPAFQERGLTKPTLYRARDVLGVVTRKRPDSDRFDWQLPKAGDSQ